jgi:hypothetical protein
MYRVRKGIGLLIYLNGNSSTSSGLLHRQCPTPADSFGRNGDRLQQPDTDDPCQSYHTLNIEGLPAFPSQQFRVGNESNDFTLDQEIYRSGNTNSILGAGSGPNSPLRALRVELRRFLYKRSAIALNFNLSTAAEKTHVTWRIR